VSKPFDPLITDVVPVTLELQEARRSFRKAATQQMTIFRPSSETAMMVASDIARHIGSLRSISLRTAARMILSIASTVRPAGGFSPNPSETESTAGQLAAQAGTPTQAPAAPEKKPWKPDGIAMWFFYVAGAYLSPPGKVGQNAASYSMQLPLDPRSLATWMSEDGDAIAIYKEAIADYNAKTRHYNIYIERGKLNSPEYKEIEKGVNLLVSASTKKGPGVFKDRPGELITYDTDRTGLKEALRTLGKAAMKVGRQSEVDKNISRAREIYRAVYTLGIKLYEERLVFDEWYEAREMLSVARWLGEIAESADEASRFKQIDGQILDFYKSKIEPVQNTIMVLYPQTGDVAALAVHGGDLMWRVEAVLVLGRCRYTSPRAGDQFGATKLIDQLLNDSEPRVKLAASAAKALTRESIHKIR